MKIVDYLGTNVSHLLTEKPFNSWPVDRDDNPQRQTIGYTFEDHGLALKCDYNGRIMSIFAEHGFDESYLEIPFVFDRSQVLKHFGKPTRSGIPNIDRTRESIPWDLFKLASHAVHIEYGVNESCVTRITFMELSRVPEPIATETILAFFPSLLATLTSQEDAKGSPLNESEVISIRDNATVIAATKDEYQKVEQARGYKDLDPENVWLEWQLNKASRK